MKKTRNRFDHPCLTVQYWVYYGADSSINQAPFIQQPEIAREHIWQLEHLISSQDYPCHICDSHELFNCSSWHLVELTAIVELWESIGVDTSIYTAELVF